MISLWTATALIAALSQTPATQPKPDPWPDDRPVAHFFQNLGTDLKSLATPDGALVLGISGAGALVAHTHDDRLRDWVKKQPKSSFSKVGNVYGDGFVQVGGAIAVWAAGKARKNPQMAHIGSDLIRAQALNGVLTQALKIAVNRTRPNGSSHAFPSGHTSASFVTAAVIQEHYGPGPALPFYAMGAFVGWSRVRSNHHWLSDAVFGAGIGLAAGMAATRDHYAKAKGWKVTPVKTSGGAALYFTKIYSP